MGVRSRCPLAAVRVSLALLVALCAAPALALRLVGTGFTLDSGRNRDVAWRDGLLYSTSEAGLQVVDVSKPDAGYTQVGRLDGSFSAVQIAGSLVFLVGPAGLTIADVSDPARPTPLGALPLSGRPLDVAVDGTRAYVAVDPLGLQVVDVSNPAAPAPLGGLRLNTSPLPEGSRASVCVENGAAYLFSPHGLDVIRVSRPALPQPLATLDVVPGAGDAEAALRDGRLYVGGTHPVHGERIHVFDVTRPEQPQYLGGAGSERFFRFTLADDTLYAATGNEFQLFDVSDPARIVPLGVLFSPGSTIALQQTAALAVGDAFAYFVVAPLFDPFWASLRSMSLEQPGYPKRTPHEPQQDAEAYESIAIAGDLLVGTVEGRLDVNSIVSPLEPVLLASLELPGIPYGIAIADQIAYVASQWDLAIVDIADPRAPKRLGALQTHATALTRHGDLLFVGTEEGYAEIYDITERSQPALRGALWVALPVPATPPIPEELDPDSIYGLELEGDVLYASSLLGVRSVDVSDPAAPRPIGAFTLPPIFYVTTMERAGSLLFLGGTSVVRIVDASNPTRLREIKRLANPGVFYLAAVGNRLVVSGQVVTVYDISRPSDPQPLGGVTGGGEAVAIAGGIVYSGAPFHYALSAIDFGPEYAVPRQLEMDLSPGDAGNRLLITEPGSVLVALASEPDLAATDVDLDSLRLGAGGAAPQTSFLWDWNHDGQPDVSALFRIEDAGIAITDSEICVTARSKDGNSLRGCDAIQPLAGCGDGFAAALIVPLLVPLGRAAARRRRGYSEYCIRK